MSGETFRPATLEELRAIVADAASDARPLAVAGADTKRGLGRPVDAERTVSTLGLAGVDLYEPEELVLSAGAGTPLAVVEALLAERGQELAFEPPDYGAVLGGAPGMQTIGGVVACNLAGPRRLKAGAARDHLLGAHCVTGRGEAIKAGGRVVKNVTGYDMCKLLTGSYGTLAVMSRVTLKVMPRAETSASLLVTGPGEADLLSALRIGVGSAHDVSGAALLPADAVSRSAVAGVSAAGRALAVLRLEGPPPSVSYRMERLRQALAAAGRGFEPLEDVASRQLWREVRDVGLLPPGELWRISLPPASAAPFVEAVDGLGGARLHDWAGGLVWLAPAAAARVAAPVIRAALAPHGGHATLVRADPDTRRDVPVFEPEPPALAALSRRVKDGFDPQRILNPGRMHPDL